MSMLQPLGPNAVRRRIEEIQARVEAASAQPGEFEKALEFSRPSPLAGSIGPTALAPFDPFGPDSEISGGGPLRPLAQRIAAEEGVDFGLFDALIQAESGYEPRARSRAGAMGLAQLMPGTARELGVTDPFDPEQNLRAGARYLGQMLKRFGDVPRALAAYNAGPGAVERAGGIPPYAETQQYVRKIMSKLGASR